MWDVRSIQSVLYSFFSFSYTHLDYAVYIVSFAGFLAYVLRWFRPKCAAPSPKEETVRHCITCRPEGPMTDSIDSDIQTLADVRKWVVWFPFHVVSVYATETRLLSISIRSGLPTLQ